MDQIDIKIIGEMGFRYLTPDSAIERRPKLQDLGRRLSLDRRTINSRIRKMERSGFISYYQVFPNFRLIGARCSVYTFVFKNPLQKEDYLKKLASIDEVIRIDEGMNSACAFILHRSDDELEKTLRRGEEYFGSPPMKAFDVFVPEIEGGPVLSNTDLRILRSLRYNGQKSAKDIASETSLTSKTVAWRLSQLLKQKALLIIPIYNSDQVSGLILYALIFKVGRKTTDETIRRINYEFSKNCFFETFDRKGGLIMMMYAKRISDVHANYKKAISILGEGDVFFDFFLKTYDDSGLIDRIIDEKLKALSDNGKLSQTGIVQAIETSDNFLS